MDENNLISCDIIKVYVMTCRMDDSIYVTLIKFT